MSNVRVSTGVASAVCGLLLTTSTASAQASAGAPAPNTLTPAEQAAGWRLLFDGKTTAGWHGFGRDSVVGWEVVGGELIALGKGGDHANDIVTDAEFEHFELKVDWKLAPRANSGIFFNVIEQGYQMVYATGPEYQLIDDDGWPDKLEDWQKSGANYAMHPPSTKATRPVGQWNTSRIVVDHGKVEHWLNGERVVAYELWTPEWERLVNAGKWKDFPGYGRARTGRIGLQDHGNKVYFRTIKVRTLPARPTPTPPGEDWVPLFNGRDLTGWTKVGQEDWSVIDGVIVGKAASTAYGYLETDKEYKDFELHLRFKCVGTGNSGVYFHTRFAPGTVDVSQGAQFEIDCNVNRHTAGVYGFGRGWIVWPAPENETVVRRNEWNELLCVVRGNRYLARLNGVPMIDFTDPHAPFLDGPIALQLHSGGDGHMQFTDIWIRDLRR